MSPSQKKIAVIGGGPMGLSAAFQLLQKGRNVTLFEADSRLGGMTASFNLDGIEIERFFHFVCKPDSGLFHTLEELGLLQHLKWQTTTMGFFYGGQLYDWGTPQHLLRFPHLDWYSKLRYGMLILYAKHINDWSRLDKQEATSWIIKWVGSRAYDVLWRPLFDLKFYDYAHRLSAAWIGTRIKRMGNSRKNLFQEELGYLDSGSELLIDAWKRQILMLGGCIKLNSKIVQITTSQGQVKGIILNGVEECFDQVISTVPLPYVTHLVPDLSPEELQKISAIHNIGVVCVVMKLKHPLTRHFWLNINDPTMQIPGIIEYTNLRELRSHVIYVPFYLPNHNPKHQQPDEQFISEVQSYLEKLNANFNDSWIEAAAVNRYHLAQPICTPGFFSSIPPMTTSIKNFFMADTTYHYPEDRAISHSIDVAERLVELAMNQA